jgi:hypothetical protein
MGSAPATLEPLVGAHGAKFQFLRDNHAPYARGRRRIALFTYDQSPQPSLQREGHGGHQCQGWLRSVEPGVLDNHL